MQIIGTIFKKELRRVLFDKKMVMALFVLPIVVMVIIYGVMGVMMARMKQDIKAHSANIVICNAPQDFKGCLDEWEKQQETPANVRYINSTKEMAEVKNEILTGTTDVMVEFEEDFTEKVATYQSGDAVAQVKTYYNPSEDYSSSAKSLMDACLEDYRRNLLQIRFGNLDDIQIFTVDSDNAESIIQDEDKAAGKTLGMMLPYMISILLFAGVMSLGVDAIAGEKERGTIATMLVAPVKRSHIVYGKLLALMVLAALSALVYGVSMIASFPTYSKILSENGVNFHISITQIVLLLILIVSMVFVYVAIISVSAVFAKSMKEASSYVMPAYMIVIVAGMMTMFVSGDTKTSAYLIPLYGSSMAMRNILTQDITSLQVLITIGTNVVIGAVVAGIVTRAFNSERVMFNA